ncbi:MAG: regulatory protein RecX [Planctomycetota bacterium]|nr:regulatory protein RecX [Planctomycetota bacterium]
MRSTSPHSAAVRRLQEQRERLDELPIDEPVRGVRAVGDDQTRFAIKVANRSFGPVHAKDLDTLGVVVGKPLSQDARGRLEDALAREAARGDALRLLGTRARAARDLLNRLARKGHDPTPAAEALDRLAAVGLINDEGLAETRAQALARAKAAGPRAAEHKLRAQGIDSALAGKAVREAFADIDLVERATAAARKRARALSPTLDEPTRRRRLYGFLARRGYDHPTCMKATTAALADDEHAGEPETERGS